MAALAVYAAGLIEFPPRAGTLTTAPAALDAPSSLTLHEATLADVSGLACEALRFDISRAKTTTRLVLVDATELAWQRLRYREKKHLFAAADPVLVDLNTLQHWLWQRLQFLSAERAFEGRDSTLNE